jgi:hypothetical protein
MKLLKNDDYRCKNMTQDLQFLSNQNTPSLCPHNDTADKLRYQCIPREFFVSVREAPSQKDARNGNPYIHLERPIRSLWVAADTKARARTHTSIRLTRVGAAEPQSLMLTKHLCPKVHTRAPTSFISSQATATNTAGQNVAPRVVVCVFFMSDR